MNYIPYNKSLKHKASYLRKNSTLAEIILWQRLKGQQLLNYDFNRQKPLLNYIVDFYCIKLNLVIEVDGSSHNENKFDYDRTRQQELENYGATFLRFTEHEVKTRIEEVLQTIEFKISELEKQHP